MDSQPQPSFWQKNRLVLKSFFIAFLVLALLIPTFIIMYLVNERKERKQEVTWEISNKWSSAQTITGPFLVHTLYRLWQLITWWKRNTFICYPKS